MILASIPLISFYKSFKCCTMRRDYQLKSVNVVMRHWVSCAIRTYPLPTRIDTEVQHHPSYSAAMDPFDYHLFSALKRQRWRVKGPTPTQPPEFRWKGMERLPAIREVIVDFNGDNLFTEFDESRKPPAIRKTESGSDMPSSRSVSGGITTTNWQI